MLASIDERLGTSPEERLGESSGRREESKEGRRGGGDGLDESGRFEDDAEAWVLEEEGTRTLFTLGERARVGLEGLRARGAGDADCCRTVEGRCEVEGRRVGDVPLRAGVGEAREACRSFVATEDDDGEVGMGMGVDLVDLWRVTGGGPDLGSSLAEKGEGIDGSLEDGCKLTRRARGRVGDTRLSTLEEEEA